MEKPSYQRRLPAPFESMAATAARYLMQAPMGRNTQALVLLSAQGKLYAACIADACTAQHCEERALLEQMALAEDTHVTHLFCMWQTGEVDLPSLAVRRMVMEMNAQNRDTELLVRTQNGYTSVRLLRTMP